jgi:hypothetical protein
MEGIEKTHTIWYFWPTISTKPKLQIATKKKTIRPTILVRRLLSPPLLCLLAPSPVTLTQSPQSSLRRPKPPTPIYCSTLTISCRLCLSGQLVPPSDLPGATPCPGMGRQAGSTRTAGRGGATLVASRER